MKIIGHRGAAGHAVENSLEGFEIAFDAGVDAIELDVRLAQDQLYVFHDEEVDRVTNASGKLATFSKSQLSQIRLNNGECIPTLADVWDITPPNVLINVELKGPNTGVPVASFIRVHSHRYLISSFLREELSLVKEYAPSVPQALLFREPNPNMVSLAHEFQVQNVHVWDKNARIDQIQDLIEAEFNVYVFTVNEVNRALELEKLGVSGVFTDLPKVMVAQRALLTG